MGSATRRAGNIPLELTSFIGRRHEIGEVKRLLGSTRLLTLTGTGGVGKTRLALRSAADLQRVYADGAWLVELAGLQDEALLAQAVAAALGLRDHSAQWVVAALSSYVAARQMLLVLDNCEHLLNACAVLSSSLLSACPGLRILATSRQPLGIAGETTITVPPLSLPAPASSPDTLTALPSEAVALFAARAAAARPSFSLTAENQAAVVQLCRRLDGIPLAIELAAVRLRALSVDEIVNRVDDRFALLTGGSRTALPRHQTLRAAIDWSHDWLSPAEQMLFRRLSVFAGGFDLPAVQAVCDGSPGPDQLLDILSELVDKSLVVRAGEGKGSRFHLLETIREYAAEKLRLAGEELPRRQQHREWLSRLALDAQEQWWGPRQVEWFDRLESEHANLRAALEFCVVTPAETEAGIEMASRLWLFWQARGHLTEARRWLSSLLERSAAPSAARARALGAAGNLALMQGEIDSASALLEESRNLARLTKDAGTVAFAIQYLGLAALFRHDLDEAVARLNEALTLYQTLGDRFGTANSLGMLARVLSARGDAGAAIARWEQAIPMSEADGERWVLSYTLWNLGVDLWIQGRYHEAMEREKSALRLKRELDERIGIALCLEALAWMGASGSRFERAARLLGASHMVWETLAATLFDAFRQYHEQCEASARRQLGDRAFEEAVRKGRAMALEDAVIYALEEKPDTAPKPRIGPTPLTLREQEVARLVAGGLADKEIAARLVIAERTAETHVEHILSKLGFRSRAQIAGWVADQPTEDELSAGSRR